MADLPFTMVHDSAFPAGSVGHMKSVPLIPPGQALAVGRPRRRKMPSGRHLADLLRRFGGIGGMQKELLFAVDLRPRGDLLAIR